MECRRRRSSGSQRAFLVCVSWVVLSALGGRVLAQQAANASAEPALPQAPSTTLLTGTVLGVIADTDDAAIPAAKVTL